MKAAKLFTKILTLICSIGCCAAVLAAPRPAKCPTVAAIKAAGIDMAEKDVEDGVYLVGKVSRYNSARQWAFMIGVPLDQAVSNQDAMNKGNNALQTLRGNPVPAQIENKYWVCFYQNNFGYQSLAVVVG